MLIFPFPFFFQSVKSYIRLVFRYNQPLKSLKNISISYRNFMQANKNSIYFLIFFNKLNRQDDYHG
ncbi:MAG TPA: hypothetical protein DCE70_01405 [Acinetobacter sp.]|nr:hypothetical protein [Acinetobacter sp.]